MKKSLLSFVIPSRLHKITLLATLLLTLGIGQMWGTDLFHETFGDNSGSARAWDDSYSVKSGIATVYSGITGYTVTNVKQGKNTTGSTGSGLNQSAQGTDAVIIIGPLNVFSYDSLTVTYQGKAGSIKGTYSTSLYYATSSDGIYTEVSGTGAGATSFVERSYSLPTSAQVSTLYLKIVWNTSNTQAIIDEVNLAGTEISGGSCEAPTSVIVAPTETSGWRYSIGETISLGATITGGTGVPTYQWQKYIGSSWTDISGANSSTYTKTNCTSSDGGSYRCVVSTGNGCSTTSDGYFIRVFTFNGNYSGSSFAEDTITWTDLNTGVVTLSLDESRIYEFKVYDNDGKTFGYSSGNFIVQPVSWDCGLNNSNCRLFTGPAGTYTFTINVQHAGDGPDPGPYVNISVAYPDVTHPVVGYVYVTKWWDCYVHWWDASNNALTVWGFDPQINTYTTICGTEYWYFPALNTYTNLNVKNNKGNATNNNTSGDQSSEGHSGKYLTYDGNSWGWHDFTCNYTITYHNLTAVTETSTEDVPQGSSTTLPMASVSATCEALGWTFAGWSASSVSNATSAPAGLLTAGSSYTPSGDVDLYAVFKMTEGSGGGSASVTFKTAGSDSNTTRETDSEIKENIVNEYYGISTFSGSRLYVGVHGAKLGTGTYSGYITLNLSSPITTNQITVIASQYSSDAGNIVATINGNTSFGEEIAPSTGTCIFTNSTNVEISSITISTTIKRAYLSSITIESSGTTYWDSNPACDGTATVTYNANGGTGTTPTDSNSPYDIGSVITVLDKGNLTNGTKAFKCWNTAADGSGTSYSPGQTFTLRGNTTLYAQWATAYTITLIDNGQTWTETAYDDEPYILPDEHLSTCPDVVFLGWATGTYTNHETGTTTAPSYDAPGSEKTISGATTFVAVYGTQVENSSNEYSLISSATELTTGDYLFVAYFSSSKYAMQSEIDNDLHSLKEESVSINNDKIISDNATLIWHVTKNGNNYTLYNATNNVYLALSSTSPLLQSTAHDFSATYDGNAWVFESVTVSGYQLVYNYWFKSAQSQDTPIRLFKRGAGIGNYTSKPDCCQEPETPLQMSSETTTLVASGSVNLTLAGGNGNNISWSTTGGTLSNKSNTGATITLSSPGVYTITATQEDKIVDGVKYCGATVNINITVKAQYTIIYQYKSGNSYQEYSRITVTEGDTYVLPDISEDFNCENNAPPFAGWVNDKNHTTLDGLAGSTQTATGNTTWYAAWGNAGYETCNVYSLVTDASTLRTNDEIVFAYGSTSVVAMGGQNNNNRDAVGVESVTGGIAFTASAGVQKVTLKGSANQWQFQVGTDEYLYAASSTSNHLKTGNASTVGNNGKWTISISDGSATIEAQGSNTRNQLKYNNSSNIFSCYSSGQKNVSIYRKTNNTVQLETSASSVTTNTSCTMGAVITAPTGTWITSSNGQKVRTTIQVKAKGFSSAQTLSISDISNSNFTASLAGTAVPSGNTGLTTSMTIEYTPTSSDTKEYTDITLAAGDVNKTIRINGRSLPDEFVIVTKKSVWYALPANMNQGAGTYNGVIVTPDDGANPTEISAAPSTIIYTLKAVANNRYDAAGQCVRLVGNSNKCLWVTSSTGNSEIQNYASLGSTNGEYYEWLLTTTDGVKYTITAPARSNAADNGRQLALIDKFGYYKQTADIYLLPVGCSSQPTSVNVSPRRVDATFSWDSNATSMQISITPKGGGTTINSTATSSPAFVTGLSQMTEYSFTLIPNGETDCSYDGEFTTSGPTVDVIDWQENAAIIQVDKDPGLNPYVIISGEHETGVENQIVATELFFSKYFEGAGSMKLIAIFNGTRNDIDLSDYVMQSYHAGQNATSYGTTPTSYHISSLGTIKTGQEIIFFTRPKNDCTEQNLYACSNSFLDQMAAKSDASENPRWIECDGTTFPAVTFNGNDAMVLKKNGQLIDVFGAANNPQMATYGNCRNTNSEKGWSGRVKNMDYGKTAADFSHITLSGSETLADYGINLTDEEIDITTARCILYRAKVTSGQNAVTNNTTNFDTFTPEEWNGRSVCTSKSRCEELGWTYECIVEGELQTIKDNSGATCNSYEDLGKFDYNNYFKDYQQIGDESKLDSKSIGNNEYKIDIANMKQYACLNVKFQLADPNNINNILTEHIEQVPIVVKGTNTTTADIFSKVIPSETNPYPNDLYEASINRCAECNVVILNGATLTKAADGTAHDVPKIRNLKIYPGGKLVVPEGTHYVINSLALRRMEDDLSVADIQAGLGSPENIDDISKKGLFLRGIKAVSLDLLIDPTNWHYVTLPYNCNIDEVTFSDGSPAVLGTDWLCAWYDGGYRAENKTGGWTDMQAGSTLKKGLGYIVSLPGSGHVKRELRFPMANDVITEENQNKNIGVLHAYGGDKSTNREDADYLGWNHRGWNMIGNPYMTYYNGSSITTPLLQGTLEKHIEDGKWNGEYDLNTGDGKNLRYVVAPIDNGWSGYVQQQIGDNLKPFTAYFVQIAGDNPETAQGVEFVATNTKHSMIRRAPEEIEDNTPVWMGLELSNPRGEQDETALLISNRFTDGYDPMDDLVKWRGTYYKYTQVTTRPVIASRNTEGEMAFNALPDATAKTGVALNYFAAERGQYTLSLSRKYSLDNIDEVWLYDSVEQIWHDLLLSDYSFSSARTDDKSRFTLTVRVRRQPKITTDISDISGLSDLRIVTGDRRLSVLSVPAGADLWIFDSSGKLIDERLSVSADRLLFDVPASGVYNVRVVTADSAVTLKAVVK